MIKLSEQAIIQKYFVKQTQLPDSVLLPIGDDATILNVEPGKQLVMSVDMSIAGVHFDESWPAKDIGYRVLAVSLSDLAAMGAVPSWVTLALSMPKVDEDWLAAFSEGFFELANAHHLTLVGGDICRGPLSMSVQVHGLIDAEQALRRDGAKVGDIIYVTGELGSAGFALNMQDEAKQLSEDDYQHVQSRLRRPKPKIEAGKALAGIAHAAIDISDGLLLDLGYLIDASHVGATINMESLPVYDGIRQQIAKRQAYELALSSGDDYELCFTAPQQKETIIAEKLAACHCECIPIGVITKEAGLRCIQADGQLFTMSKKGYQHFNAS